MDITFFIVMNNNIFKCLTGMVGLNDQQPFTVISSNVDLFPKMTQDVSLLLDEEIFHTREEAVEYVEDMLKIEKASILRELQNINNQLQTLA